LQSKLDRRAAEAEQRAQQAEQRLEAAEARAQAAQARADAITRTIEGLDPEAAQVIVAEAQQAEREAQLAAREDRLARQEYANQQQQYRQGILAQAAQAGMDVQKYHLIEAIEEALRTGNGAPVQRCFDDFRVDQRVAAALQAQGQGSEPSPAPAPTVSSALPPAGGSVIAGRNPARIEQINAELQGLLLEPTKYRDRIKALQDERAALQAR